MKRITQFLLIGFIVVNVFGFGFMSHNENHGAGNCIASFVDKVACPQIGLDTVSHHFNFYQIFSEAIITSTISIYFAIFILSLGFLIWVQKKYFNKEFLTISIKYLQSKKNKPELYLREPRRITAWLALFENSPSV